MRLLNRLIWVALIAGTTATPIFAQAGGTSGGSAGGAAGGSAGGASGGSAGGTSLPSTTLSTLGSTPSITAPAATGGSNSSLSTSNFFSPYYANPYYQGVLTNSQSNNNNPGGFGTPLFNGTSGGTTGGGQIGYAGTSTTSTAGRSGGIRGSTSTSSTSTVVINLPVQISYRAISAIKDVPQVTSTQLQAELITMIARSKDYPVKDLQVSTDANVVTVRGIVKDPEAARTIGSMIRMTPGVRSVNNELLFPVAKQP